MKTKILRIVAGLCVLFLAVALYIGVPKAEAATQTEINLAISNGLAWLATQQNATSGIFGGVYPLANTAAAVLAFENEGYFPDGATAYSDEVEKGLDYIFTRAFKVSVSNQTAGYSGRNDNPDTNGNGQGIYFASSYPAYETGMVMQTIVASNTPNRVVTTGACNGMTYQQVLTDVVDWVAWSQIDGGYGRGGWRYGACNNCFLPGDNSVSPWPVFGLIAAEQWGIYAPQFVKDELNIWIDYIQHSSGCSGYTSPYSYVNISKTGGLLVEMYYVGDDNATTRAQKAIDCINTRWGGSPSGFYGNKGHPYAMFGVFKGLELMKVDTIPNAPASDETLAGDWWGDYCEYLVNDQNADGSWTGYSSWNRWLSTPWYIVILQATVFPVQVEIDVPECACDTEGYDVDVSYSVERLEANGTLEISEDDILVDTVPIADFQGAATYTYTVESDSPGTHTWKAILAVTSGDISAQAEDTDSLDVCESPDVGDIPDQTTPFGIFDLDDYLTYSGDGVVWSATAPPAGWTVVIDGANVVTVTAPEEATDPETITFTASIECCSGVTCSDSDDAIFTPNRPPVAQCQDIEVALDETGQATISASDVDYGSYDPDDDPITLSLDKTDFTCTDLGSNSVTLTVTDDSDASDSCQATVIVVDTTPPIIEYLNASPNVLWRSNHKMVQVTLNASVSDNCDPSPIFVLTSVTSNEPDDAKGIGDGNTKNDIQGADIGTEDYVVYLRAERSGRGTGRVYTISYTATDASSNSTTVSITVNVPHDKR